MPVRKVSNHGGNAIGRFPSTKMGRMIAFESLLERDFIYLLDYDPVVDWFEEQPLSIEYQQEEQLLHYTPDFHLLEDDRHVLVECKPERFVDTDENRRKLAVGQAWCEKQGWEFRLVTDQQVRRGNRLQNIKLLSQYARQKVDSAVRNRIQTFLLATQTPVSLHELVQAIAPMASIFCLAYHHEIELAIDEAPISGTTLVSCPAQKPKERVQ
jgi:hypothetical protein